MAQTMRRSVIAGATVAALMVSGAAAGAAAAEDVDEVEGFTLEPIDAQNWQNQEDMTWENWTDIPGTDWNNPENSPGTEALNIALVAVDFPDQEFVITKPKGSDLFGNPQIDPIPREEVPEFYRDFYMYPSELNQGRTVQEYWLEMSRGEYGIDFMDAFGPYEMDRNLFEYGLNEWGQEGACPDGFTCDGRLDPDVVEKWKTEMAAEDGLDPAAWCEQQTQELGGPAENCGYDVILRIYAGYDETSIWQEFGPMMFPTKESIPDEWGPPEEIKGDLPNWAPTRYVEWTSWQAAAQQWGIASIRQAESSGTITHEMGHFFFRIGDNNNNPFSEDMDPPSPYHRVGAAPWDMFDRGSFNGPGGHHMRWVIPANMGGWSPAGIMLRNKISMGIVPENNVTTVNSAELAETGVIVDTVTARAVDPGAEGTSGIRIILDGGDQTAWCDVDEDPMCDGNDPDSDDPREYWNDYTLEVVDRMGFDSFTPDSGVIIAKNKQEGAEGDSCGYNCFNWVIDANPEDIGIVDYYKPTTPGEWADGGEPVMASIADHRQLNDAAFKAGLNSGSKFEWVDEANGLHFYVVDTARDDEGILSYDLAVRSVNGSGEHARGVAVDSQQPALVSQGNAAQCEIEVTNTGEDAGEEQFSSDIYRVQVDTESEGWDAQIQNALLSIPAGETETVSVYAVLEDSGTESDGTVAVTVTSESDPAATESVDCVVTADFVKGEDGEVAPTIQVDPEEVLPGHEIEVTGAGLEPREEYELELHSIPSNLGTVVSTDEGTFAVSVVVPDSVPAGAHEVRLISSAGETVAIAPLHVLEAPGSGDEQGSSVAVGAGNGGNADGTLSSTGATLAPWFVGGAIVLILAGFTSWGLARRSRTGQSE